MKGRRFWKMRSLRPYHVNLPSHSGPVIIPECVMELMCSFVWEARTDPQSGMLSRKGVALWSVFIIVTHFLKTWVP